MIGDAVAFTSPQEAGDRGSAPPALVLESIAKRMGRRIVIADASATFGVGELSLIRGVRGSGKSVLARLIAGQILPDTGRIRRLGFAAPMVGSSWGFTAEAPATQGLELRAASYGLSARAYAAAALALADDPEAARRNFNRLGGRDRQILLFASAYLIPSSVYVADGALLPADLEVRKRLKPLLAAARKRAAVIWIADHKTRPHAFTPDRLLRLEAGRLRPDDEPTVAGPQTEEGEVMTV